MFRWCFLSVSLMVANFAIEARAQTTTIGTAGKMLGQCEFFLALTEMTTEDFNELKQPIETLDRVAGAQECIGLARGVSRMLALNCWSRSQGYNPMFTAEAPSVRDSIEAFVNWVRANPESREEPDTEIMVAVQMVNFPCPQ